MVHGTSRLKQVRQESGLPWGPVLSQRLGWALRAALLSAF